MAVICYYFRVYVMLVFFFVYYYFVWVFSLVMVASYRAQLIIRQWVFEWSIAVRINSGALRWFFVVGEFPNVGFYGIVSKWERRTTRCDYQNYQHYAMMALFSHEVYS